MKASYAFICGAAGRQQYLLLFPLAFSLFVDGDPYIRASHNFVHGLRAQIQMSIRAAR